MHKSRASLRSDFSSAGTLIHGKERWMWVEDACRAIIASTTAVGRWEMVREGFPKFQVWALSAFRNLSPFAFNAGEIRQMFDGLIKYAETHDKRLHPFFERMYDHRHQWDKTKPIETEATVDDTIRVESVRDGFLKRVS